MQGFSLVEMLVAMAILALSLGVLYQAAAGATRNVRIDERYTYAVQIAQSLLAEYPALPPEGVSSAGVMGDFSWQLDSSPWDAADSVGSQARAVAPVELLQLVALVRWEGSGTREVRLTTVVPERAFDPPPEPANAF
ncbi:MAG TPA: type II secretion system protein [Pseudomonadaceae bacterium]|nr:type II secretion system protein [Pseudomonadaceae bacterium]